LPLAMRVEIGGASRAHDALQSDVQRWTNELRGAALAAPGGRIWIEKVKWRTTPQREADGDDHSGPLATLHECLQELRGDEAGLAELATLLCDLQKKLPEELTRGEDALQPGDPVQIRQWLDEVEPLLMNRLRKGACG